MGEKSVSLHPSITHVKVSHKSHFSWIDYSSNTVYDEEYKSFIFLAGLFSSLCYFPLLSITFHLPSFMNSLLLFITLDCLRLCTTSLIQLSFYTLTLTLLHNCHERPRGPASILYNVKRGYFLGLKRPVRSADYPPQSTHEYSHISTRSLCLQGMLRGALPVGNSALRNSKSTPTGNTATATFRL